MRFGPKVLWLFLGLNLFVGPGTAHAKLFQCFERFQYFSKAVVKPTVSPKNTNDWQFSIWLSTDIPLKVRLRNQLEQELVGATVSRIYSNPEKGKAQSFIVEFDNGLKAIFKPRQLQSNLLPLAVEAEAAAYAIDKLLGFEMVPVTVKTRLTLPGAISKTEGSLQLYIDDAGYAANRALFEKLVRSKWIAKSSVMDFIIGNHDRSGNLLGKVDRYIHIDNSDSFVFDMKLDRFAAVWGKISKGFLKSPEFPKLRKIEKLEFEKVLTENGISPTAAEESWKRFQAMLDFK